MWSSNRKHTNKRNRDKLQDGAGREIHHNGYKITNAKNTRGEDIENNKITKNTISKLVETVCRCDSSGDLVRGGKGEHCNGL